MVISPKIWKFFRRRYYRSSHRGNNKEEDKVLDLVQSHEDLCWKPDLQSFKPAILKSVEESFTIPIEKVEKMQSEYLKEKVSIKSQFGSYGIKVLESGKRSKNIKFIW